MASFGFKTGVGDGYLNKKNTLFYFGWGFRLFPSWQLSHGFGLGFDQMVCILLSN